MRRRQSWEFIRDIVLFFSGLGGVYHEAIRAGASERPTLLILFAAMMGLPAFLRTDIERRERQDLERQREELESKAREIEAATPAKRPRRKGNSGGGTPGGSE